MKQVMLRRGKISISDVPAPALHPKSVLVEVSHSLISSGTELSTVESSGATLVDKVKENPSNARKVLNSIKIRGVKKTWDYVQDKLGEQYSLGYSCSGTVLAVGGDVTEFQIGDHVACAGTGFANHAEVISVPVHLVAKIPASMDHSLAAFVTVGAIALQSVRRADLRIGETVCVIGLGLIGQLAAQIASAAGCRVIGMDNNAQRLELARKLGLKAGESNENSLKSLVNELTDNQGVDATIITASTDSSEPTNLAFHVTRKKGRVVVVGNVGMSLQRSPFYEKEQDFLISCSYGPGRYDSSYEINGQDYPYPYVRWTENRNMKAFLALISEGKVQIESLIEASYPIAKADEAYEALKSTDRRPLAILLKYPETEAAYQKSSPVVTMSVPKTTRIRLGVIGAGSFFKIMHLPNLRSLERKVELTAVCAATAATAHSMGRQMGASMITTDYNELLKSPDIDAVLISTRHNLHASLTMAALSAGKHVFVEKPLALTSEELALLDQSLSKMANAPVLMVGYNRRFSPITRDLSKGLKKRSGPVVILYRVNAGSLSKDDWANGPEGGGRLIGEACHMIDFFQSVVGSAITEVSISSLKSNHGIARPDENFSAQIMFQDGSLCELLYTSIGHSSLPKERIELFWDGHSSVIDDYKKFTLDGNVIRSASQDKGHLASLEAFFDAVAKGSGNPISWAELHASAQAAIDLNNQVWGRLIDTNNQA